MSINSILPAIKDPETGNDLEFNVTFKGPNVNEFLIYKADERKIMSTPGVSVKDMAIGVYFITV